MSCNEEAKGTIRIPAKEAVALRRDFATEARRIIEARHRIARDVYEKLRGRKVPDIDDALAPMRIDDADADYVRDAISTYDYATHVWKIRAPKRPKAPALRTRTLTLAGDDWTISVDGRDVHIRIHENNHAIEHAQRDRLFNALLRRLGRVVWTRGSGGTVLEQNEYQRDAFAPPSTLYRFGPDVPRPIPLSRRPF